MTHKGFTLIEMMIVVSMISALIVATLQFYKTSSESQKIARAIQEKNQIFEAIRNIHGVMQDYRDLDNKSLVESNSLPISVLTPDPDPNSVKREYIASPWARNGITIKSSSIANPDDSFSLSYDSGITPDICISLVSQICRTDDYVKVDGKVIHDLSADPQINANITTISNACNINKTHVPVEVISY